MHLEHPHQLGQAAAVQRIDSFVTDLLQRPLPAGVTVTNPQRSWSGNTMTFSFRASRAFVGATIRGKIVVTDTNVVADVDVPAIIGALVGEDQIKQAALRQLDGVLSA